MPPKSIEELECELFKAKQVITEIARFLSPRDSERLSSKIHTWMLLFLPFELRGIYTLSRREEK
jgi:hypothetical protein